MHVDKFQTWCILVEIMLCITKAIKSFKYAYSVSIGSVRCGGCKHACDAYGAL